MKNPCPPKSECWCETHPSHKDCIPDLPIESIFFGMLIIILIIIKTYKKCE
jgi:hypothetical protein